MSSIADNLAVDIPPKDKDKKEFNMDLTNKCKYTHMSFAAKILINLFCY